MRLIFAGGADSQTLAPIHQERDIQVVRVFLISAAALLSACGADPAERLDDEAAGHVFISKSRFDLLANLSSKPLDLVVAGGAVIWSAEDGTISKLNPSSGAAPSIIASGQFDPRSLAATADTIVWANFKGSTVMRLPAAGGDPIVIAQAQAQPASVTIDGSYTYWAEYAFNGDVSRAQLPGGAPADIHVDRSAPEGLSACGGWLYWVESDGRIFRGAADGTARTSLVTGQSDAVATACDSTHVYWINSPVFGKGSVGRVDVNGGNPQMLANGQSWPTSLAVDGAHVYWTDKTDGAIRRVAKAGGTVDTVVDGQSRPVALALDDLHVYWAAEGSSSAEGLVGRKPKP